MDEMPLSRTKDFKTMPIDVAAEALVASAIIESVQDSAGILTGGMCLNRGN